MGTNSRIGVIGAGLMGSAIIRALLRSGAPVTVWNRTRAKCEPLRALGADVAQTPRELAAAADLILTITATCDEVGDIVADCAERLRGKDLVNLVTGTPAQVRALRRLADEYGAGFLSGTIQAFPSAIGAADTMIVFGGDAQVWERHETTLRALAGAAAFSSPDPALPNVFDAALTGCFAYAAMAASLEAARYARKEGVDLATFRDWLGGHLAALPTLLTDLLDAVEAELYETDEATLEVILRSQELFTSAFADAKASDYVLSGVRNRMRAAVAAGDAARGFSALYRH